MLPQTDKAAYAPRLMRRGIGLGLVCALSLCAPSLRAEPKRDYFLDAPAAGTYTHIDGYNVGTQASLEDRRHLEEGMSMFHTRVSGVLSYPYADGSLNLDARAFLFTLGGSVGYRQVYRDFTYAPGADTSREKRLELDEDKEFGSQGFAYGEGRLRLVVPLDPFFLVSSGTLRWEDCNDNSFDWFHSNVHDGGQLNKVEATLFFRHRDFGAIGPYVRYMDMPVTKNSGRHGRDQQLHYGFVYGTRPGFIRPRHGNIDLFLLQVIADFQDDEFGVHTYRVPAYILAVYRATLRLL
jgi:hypothetical protein